MFSFLQRVITTRDGKVYSNELDAFQDQESVVICKGFLGIFQYRIYKEQIIEDYVTISRFGYITGILLALALLVGVLNIASIGTEKNPVTAEANFSISSNGNS